MTSCLKYHVRRDPCQVQTKINKKNKKENTRNELSKKYQEK